MTKAPTDVTAMPFICLQTSGGTSLAYSASSQQALERP
jgi:hypothetical protein